MSNQTSPASLRVVSRWSTQRAQDWATQALPALCSDPHVLAVIALGSAVRQASSAYDFDCLYIYRGVRPRVYDIPHDVDLRGYEVSQVDNLISSGHDLLVWTIKFGRVVCERNKFWSTLSATWISKLPF